MSAYHAAYPITSVHLGGAEYDFLTAYFKIYGVEVFAVAGVDAVPGVAGVAVAVSEYEVAAPPAGAGATTLRSMSSARSPVGAKYFAMMELIPLLLLSSSEKSS